MTDTTSPAPATVPLHHRAAAPRERGLGDFTTDRRVLLLVAMALIIGTAGTFAALLLLKLIGLVSNLVWLH